MNDCDKRLAELIAIKNYLTFELGTIRELILSHELNQSQNTDRNDLEG